MQLSGSVIFVFEQGLNATRKDFDYIMRCITKGLIDPLSFITNSVKFKDAAKGFPEWLNPSSNMIKVIIEND